MKPENWISLLQVAMTVIALFVGPWWAVRRSISQFHEQKLWEKKIEIYQLLINDMSALYEHYGDSFIRAVTDKPPLEFTPELKEAHAKLARHANAGGFIISRKAETALKKIIVATDMDRYHSSPEYYDGASGGLQEGLKALIECAREDCGFAADPS